MSPRHPDPCIQDLPEPVMVDILSRLPVKTIVHCNCVCKKWRNIVLDSYFADLQLSRSPASFMIYHTPSILKWVEVEDELNHHNLHHDPVMSLDLNLAPTLKDTGVLPVGTVNGLVCLWQYYPNNYDNTYICNPITREYMILPRHQNYREDHSVTIFYCFGVGSLTRKYKVIRICQKSLIFRDSTRKFRLGLSEAEVYTLGTGQWRSLGHVPYMLIGFYGHFLNGHAHWTIGDQNCHERISSFNFDNETFELFPSPPSEATEESWVFRRLRVLKGCLCRCDTDNYNYKLTIWVMKEYGIKKSWHKELVIQQSISPNVNISLRPAFPVEGFKDGTILMETFGKNLIVYCPRKKAILETDICDGPVELGMAYRPSFHRLKNFENKSVLVFKR